MTTGEGANRNERRPDGGRGGGPAPGVDGDTGAGGPLRSLYERLRGLIAMGHRHDDRSKGTESGAARAADGGTVVQESRDTSGLDGDDGDGGVGGEDGERDDDGDGDRDGGGDGDRDGGEAPAYAMGTLHDATRDMVTADSKQTVVEIGLDAAADVLGFSNSGIHFHDEEEDALVPVTWTSSLEEDLGEPPALGPDSMAWSVYEDGEVVRVDDFWEGEGAHNPDTPFRSEMIVPLGGHGVALFSSTEPHTFDAEDERFAEVLCSNAAAAMDRISREEDLRRRERELERQNELLARLTADVEGSVDELVDTSEDVAGSSQQISALAEEEANTMARVSAEVSDVSAVVEEIASLADDVGDTSEATLELAEDGHDSATDATDVMEDIEAATAEVTDEFDDLHAGIAEIDEIVEVIDSVADRTNLLALNASIEAASAGEGGEGFAVVAEEVKSLAEEAQQQAGRIEERVAGIQDDTDETVDRLRATTERVQEGIEQVERTRRNFAEIVEAVTETAEGVEEVANATEDQAESSEEIARMVDEAVGKAEEVSAEIQEIAAANQQQVRRVEEIRESLESANRQIGDADSGPSER